MFQLPVGVQLRPATWGVYALLEPAISSSKHSYKFSRTKFIANRVYDLLAMALHSIGVSMADRSWCVKECPFHTACFCQASQHVHDSRSTRDMQQRATAHLAASCSPACVAFQPAVRLKCRTTDQLYSAAWCTVCSFQQHARCGKQDRAYSLVACARRDSKEEVDSTVRAVAAIGNAVKPPWMDMLAGAAGRRHRLI